MITVIKAMVVMIMMITIMVVMIMMITIMVVMIMMITIMVVMMIVVIIRSKEEQNEDCMLFFSNFNDAVYRRREPKCASLDIINFILSS